MTDRYGTAKSVLVVWQDEEEYTKNVLIFNSSSSTSNSSSSSNSSALHSAHSLCLVLPYIHLDTSHDLTGSSSNFFGSQMT